MKIVIIIARVFLALPIVIFGLNGFLGFLPTPMNTPLEGSGIPPELYHALRRLWDSGFLIHSVCVVHITSGLLLIVGRYLPLALAIHLPVSIQMVLFHVYFHPSTGLFAYVIFSLNILLILAYRKAYYPLLQAKYVE